MCPDSNRFMLGLKASYFSIMSTSTYPAYPIDCSSCMTNNGPVDGHFIIPSGTLQYNAKIKYFILLICVILTHMVSS